MVFDQLKNAFGGGNVSPVAPPPVNICEEYEKGIIKEMGADYKAQLVATPALMAEVLPLVYMVKCNDYFKYNDLVRDFCADPKNFDVQIGGGLTCADKDPTNEVRKQWCLDDDDGARMKTDGKCSRSSLGTKYEETATAYCKKKRTDEWCSCYNLVNDVCAGTPDAGGCKRAHGMIDNNKAAFKDGYDILKKKTHCRPSACRREYLPTGYDSDCEPSYRMCGKDIDIRNQTDSDIAVACNRPGIKLNKPDWWDDLPDDDGFFERVREPPFDKFPFTLLPITRIPRRFRWRDRNVRNLTYGGVSSISMSCLCIAVIGMSMR